MSSSLYKLLLWFGPQQNQGKGIYRKNRIYRMVLCMHTATWPGRGPCLAKTVWAGSREIFLFLFGNGSNRNREWGLLGRDSPEKKQKDIPGLVWEWLAGTIPHKNKHFYQFWKQTNLEEKCKLTILWIYKVIIGLANCRRWLFFHLFKFLILLNQSEQDRELLSALSLDCLCPAGPTPCSC